MNDPAYVRETLGELTRGQRCTGQQAREVMPVLRAIYEDVSVRQKQHQKEPHYSALFKDEVFRLVYANSYGGSRTVRPTQDKFKVKTQRAIMQSFISDSIGFHPELLFWDQARPTLAAQIIEQLGNPILQDLLNHYTALYLVNDYDTACSFIQADETKRLLAQSLQAFKALLEKVKAAADAHPAAKRLLLCHSDAQRLSKIFDASHLSDSEVTSKYAEFAKHRLSGDLSHIEQLKGDRSLFYRAGLGYCTVKRE